MSQNSRVIIFRFNGKTQWQMFLLLYGRHVGDHLDSKCSLQKGAGWACKPTSRPDIARLVSKISPLNVKNMPSKLSLESKSFRTAPSRRITLITQIVIITLKFNTFLFRNSVCTWVVLVRIIGRLCWITLYYFPWLIMMSFSSSKFFVFL